MHSRGPSPKTSTTPLSTAPILPHEIIEMIIANLMYDMRSLRACSLTCYSWYIVAAPRLHRTLVVRADGYYQKLRWPEAIFYKHRLGLLPLVRKLHIKKEDALCGSVKGVPPKMFSCFTRYKFSGFTNIQELVIDYLDIPKFIQKPRWYFRYFLPTIRSLSLRKPYGSHWQIVFFIGLFRHLEDLNLIFWDEGTRELKDVPAPAPPFIPPLRGRLTMVFSSAQLPEAMINVFGGVLFRYMELFDVGGMRILLDAGADTLETVRFYRSDPNGE